MTDYALQGVDGQLMTYSDHDQYQTDSMSKYVCTVRTICPGCRLYYQRPVTAKELLSGGGTKEIVCECCLEHREKRRAEYRPLPYPS